MTTITRKQCNRNYVQEWNKQNWHYCIGCGTANSRLTGCGTTAESWQKQPIQYHLKERIVISTKHTIHCLGGAKPESPRHNFGGNIKRWTNPTSDVGVKSNAVIQFKNMLKHFLDDNSYCIQRQRQSVKGQGRMGYSKNRRKSNNTVKSNNGKTKTQTRPTQDGNKDKRNQQATKEGTCRH